MKKENFVSLLLGVGGILVFGIGMCMCLLPEWHLFKPGMAVTAVGAVILTGLALVRWNMAGRPVGNPNWKAIGRAAYCVISVLVLGVGMAMILVWNMIIPGLLAGVAGIAMIICIVLLFKGLK